MSNDNQKKYLAAVANRKELIKQQETVHKNRIKLEDERNEIAKKTSGVTDSLRSAMASELRGITTAKETKLIDNQIVDISKDLEIINEKLRLSQSVAYEVAAEISSASSDMDEILLEWCNKDANELVKSGIM